MDFLQRTGVDARRAHEATLTVRFLRGLADIPGVRLCGTADPDRRVGVISLDFPEKDNGAVSARLEREFGILTRCGLHCAPSAHRTLGTFPAGTVRFSLGFTNTEADVDAALEAIRTIV